MRRFAGLSRTEVGYQPTGMKPSGLAASRSATLKTAMLFASALATKSISPSGVRQRLFGVLPLGAFGYKEHEIVCNPRPSAGSRTLTFVELAQATYSALPSARIAISVGCFSVAQVAVTFF